RVSDSVISGNGLPASGGGIVIQPSGSGGSQVLIERTRVENNTYGIFANGTASTGVISVQITDSTVVNSRFDGVSAFTAAGHATTSVVVNHSAAVLNNNNGILSEGAPGFVILDNSTVMQNATGLRSI